MEQTERGVVHYPKRAKQLILFRNLKYDNNVTPTDIDGVIEINDKFWIIYEAKYNGAPLQKGQKLTLERWINEADKAEKYGIALVADHYVSEESEPVYLDDCKVRMIYTTENRTWHKPETEMTVKEISDKYYDLYKNAPAIPLFLKVACIYGTEQKQRNRKEVK